MPLSTVIDAILDSHNIFTRYPFRSDVIQYIRSLSLSVPAPMSVYGFLNLRYDNENKMAAGFRFKITSNCKSKFEQVTL